MQLCVLPSSIVCLCTGWLAIERCQNYQSRHTRSSRKSTFLHSLEARIADGMIVSPDRPEGDRHRATMNTKATPWPSVSENHVE